MAAHVAAMAPGTNIGAAHPVDVSQGEMSATMADKVTNDAAAYIQAIAQQRGRNADWAAATVRESSAATAEEALGAGAIDLLAADLNDLLNQVDGRSVETAAGEVTLQTSRAGLVTVPMNPAEQFFHTLVDPNIALILLLIGLVAIAIELYNPGAILPAVTGGICLILAFIALGNLPVNWGAAILVVVSVILFLLDIKVQGYALSVAGIVMLVIGGLLLFTPFTPPSPIAARVRVSPIVLAVTAGSMAAFFIFILGAAVRGRHFPVLSGAQTVIGATGTAVTDLSPAGQVQVRSELWTAVAQGESIPKGALVEVIGVEGLRLKVVRQPDRSAIGGAG